MLIWQLLSRSGCSLKQYGRSQRSGPSTCTPSLLPDYRGAAPINWVIINGESQTGITTFFIDKKIDTGAILFQEKD